MTDEDSIVTEELLSVLSYDSSDEGPPAKKAKLDATARALRRRERENAKSRAKLSEATLLEFDKKLSTAGPAPLFPTSSSEPSINDAKIIAVYSEKGGVGKSTNCINLAVTLASMGKKVLIYDLDPQRSLTAWIFGTVDEIGGPALTNERGEVIQQATGCGGDVSSFIHDAEEDSFARGHPRTFFDQFTNAQRTDVRAAWARRPTQFHHLPLWVVPGHRETSTLDSNITLVEKLSDMQANAQTGAPYHLICETARYFEVDIVLLDLNPNSGALNRCLITTSHYLITPTTPDFFCREMMSGLGKLLIDWNRIMNIQSQSTRQTKFPLPPHRVKYLGYILSRYIPYGWDKLPSRGLTVNGIAADVLPLNMKFWEREIGLHAERVGEVLAEEVHRPGSTGPYVTAVVHPIGRGCLLAKIRDFFTFRNLSDFFKIPVHMLRKRHLVKVSHLANGRVNLESMDSNHRDSRIIVIDFWLQVYLCYARNVLKAIENDAESVNV